MELYFPKPETRGCKANPGAKVALLARTLLLERADKLKPTQAARRAQESLGRYEERSVLRVKQQARRIVRASGCDDGTPWIFNAERAVTFPVLGTAVVKGDYICFSGWGWREPWGVALFWNWRATGFTGGAGAFLQDMTRKN